MSITVETKAVTSVGHSEKGRQSTEDSINVNAIPLAKPEVHSNNIASSTDVTNCDVAMHEDTSGCSRLALLLNASQLISELYPLPGYEEYLNFKFTQELYDPVTDRSPMFSLDCEWCICIDGK